MCVFYSIFGLVVVLVFFSVVVFVATIIHLKKELCVISRVRFNQAIMSHTSSLYSLWMICERALLNIHGKTICWCKLCENVVFYVRESCWNCFRCWSCARSQRNKHFHDDERAFDRVKYSSQWVLAISIGRKTNRWDKQNKERDEKEGERSSEKLRIPSKLDLSAVFRLEMSNHYTITLYIAMNYSLGS